ncbi:putative reverse transcriptase domain, reverse transcriptase zinc-binding domain protein [Tanacetum coccineum]
MERGFLSSKHNGSKVTPNLGNLATKVKNIDGTSVPLKSILKKPHVKEGYGVNNAANTGLGVKFVAKEVHALGKAQNEGAKHSNVNFSQVKSVNSMAENDHDLADVATSGFNCVNKKCNFRTLFNEEKLESFDMVLPKSVMDRVKHRFENSLVGYFIGKSLAFPIVQNYVNNTWGKFGLQRLMKNPDGVFLFQFATKSGLEQVTKVPVWIKMHKVPIVAYSEDGLSLIATQIEKPIMLDAFMSSMCNESWGRINFARALVEVSAEADLKKEVSMAVPVEDGDGYTREVVSVEYEWQPPGAGETKGRRDDGGVSKPGPIEQNEKPNSGPNVSKPKGNDKVRTSQHACGDSFISMSNTFDLLNNIEGDVCGNLENTVSMEMNGAGNGKQDINVINASSPNNKNAYAKEANVASTSNPDLSIGGFDFGEPGESDKDEVLEPDGYMSSLGGGFQLEDDFSDGYEAQIYDLPRQLDAFCD